MTKKTKATDPYAEDSAAINAAYRAGDFALYERLFAALSARRKADADAAQPVEHFGDSGFHRQLLLSHDSRRVIRILNP